MEENLIRTGKAAVEMPPQEYFRCRHTFSNLVHTLSNFNYVFHWGVPLFLYDWKLRQQWALAHSLVLPAAYRPYGAGELEHRMKVMTAMMTIPFAIRCISSAYRDSIVRVHPTSF